MFSLSAAISLRFDGPDQPRTMPFRTAEDFFLAAARCDRVRSGAYMLYAAVGMWTGNRPLQQLQHKRIGKIDTRIERTAYGWPAFWMALPFVAIGAWFSLAGFGVLPLPGKANAPAAVIGWIGVAFGMGGLMLLGHALRGILERRRVAALAARSGNRPWMRDYPWNPSGIDDHAAGRWVRALIGTLFLAAFLVPFNWLSYFSGERGSGIFVFQIVTALFDAVLVLTALSFVYRFLQYLKYGPAHLAFATFPFMPGEHVRLGFSPNRFARLDLTLRFVQESFVARRRGGKRHVSHQCEQLFVRQWSLSPDLRSDEAVIEFELPDDAGLVTQLRADPAVRYWELVVDAHEPGIDFHTSFPLPVYPCEHGQVVAMPKRRPGGRRRFVRPYTFELGLPLAFAAAIGAAWTIAPDTVEQASRKLGAGIGSVILTATLRPLDAIDNNGMDLQRGPDGAVWALGKYTLARIENDDPHVVLDAKHYRARFERRFDALSALWVDGADEAWVGSWHGELLRWQAGEWTTVSLRDAPLRGRIHALMRSGDLLYVAAHDGFWQRDEDGALAPVAGVPAATPTTALAVDNRGRMLAGIGREVWRRDAEGWRRLWAGEPAARTINALAPTGASLLVGTSAGLYELDAAGQPVRVHLSGQRIRAIAMHGEQAWVSVWGQGVRIEAAEGGWAILDGPRGLPSEDVSAVLIDDGGTAWFATYGRGLTRAPAERILAAMSPK